MSWQRVMDPFFPVIEPLTTDQIRTRKDSLASDIAGIETAEFDVENERALDEAQRVAAAEIERVRTAEGKATTYLAVLAALVPLVITLQAATWENKTGPAPEALTIAVLAIATIYVAAAGYHAFKTLRVSGFQRIGEAEIVSAWASPKPIKRLARDTLLASRRSRDNVNAKVTRIKVTHQHLIRAFGAFVLLLMLDPIFYGLGFRNDEAAPASVGVADTARKGAEIETTSQKRLIVEENEHQDESGKGMTVERSTNEVQPQ